MTFPDVWIFQLFFLWTLCLQENQKLKQELLKSQTEVACLQSDMDSLKTELTDQSINSER